MSFNDPQIEVVVEPDLQGRIVVVVRGVLDLPEAPILREVLDKVVATDCPQVVVDLHGVTFVGTSGLGLLLQVHQDLEGQQRRLAVRGTSPSIRRAFEITRLDQVLELEDPDLPTSGLGSPSAC